MSSPQQVMPLRHVISPAAPSKPSTSTAVPSTSESAAGDNLTSDKTLKEEEEIERQKMQYV
jgi:hypothetical protein